ncbi:hypothetical protein ACS0TY_022854 [Phlomoides rotata]
MVAEPWILKVGNQDKFKLKNEILNSQGIRTLISSDENQLLELALMEKLDDLNRIACVVSRLGKKCTIPALQGFEHVYGDIVSGVIDVKDVGFLVKDMDSMMRRMERYVNYTVSLYSEMEVLNELEIATKKFQQNQLEESRKAFEQKLVWQKQDVRHLKDVSLWNQTYDKVVEVLARTVCTVYARIHVVFGDPDSRGRSDLLVARSCNGSLRRKPGQFVVVSKAFVDEGSEKRAVGFRPKGGSFGPEDFNFACGMGPGRMFLECLSLTSSASKVDDHDRVNYDDQSNQISGDFSVAKSDSSSLFANFRRPITCVNGENTRLQPKSRLLVHAPPNTVGGSALALHYANVIIIIEKLLRYPHLVGDEARDDLYQMLPTRLKRTLKAKLKSYTKNVAIYDAPLAHDWRERLEGMLTWLAPLAHNMIRWQSERNFEQQQIVTRTNVLLLQTLYLADRDKTDEVICELLIGLNYICRYEQQQNALLDCASSFDYEDCMEWQSQARASFRA